MTRKRRRPGRTILQPSSIGALPPPLTSLYWLLDSSHLISYHSINYNLSDTERRQHSLIVLLLPESLTPFVSLQLANYEKELEEMKMMTKQEFVASLRRYVCMPALVYDLSLSLSLSLHLTNNSSLLRNRIKCLNGLFSDNFFISSSSKLTLFFSWVQDLGCCCGDRWAEIN